MSVAGAVAKYMLSAGASHDDVVKAIAEVEVETIRLIADYQRMVAPARSKAAERQARYRERNKASQSVTSDACDAPQVSPSSFPPTPPHITTPSFPPVLGCGDDARAGWKSLVSEDAFAVVSEILEFANLDSVHPLGYGAPMQVQAWLNEGCSPPVILAAVKRSLANKRDGPPKTFAYFRNAVAQERARIEEKLPEVMISTGPKLEVVRGQQRPDYRNLAEDIIQRARGPRAERATGGLLADGGGVSGVVSQRCSG